SGVAEMDKVVQQNASNSEETAAAAEELTAQAGELEEIVIRMRKLVNGNKEAVQGNGSAPGQRAGLKEKSAARGNNNGKTAVKKRLGPRHQKSPQPAGPGPGMTQRPKKEQAPAQKKPEEVIPLDEDDFKDF
ncbi:MAG: hypothetical protein K9K64_05900, partial [Desulfohalobiaceae bacterium]|nr:hypothetical protein [Desulfohalobiaceae bacterium]